MDAEWAASERHVMMKRRKKEGEASQFCRVDAGKTMLELMMRFDVMSKCWSAGDRRSLMELAARWMYRCTGTSLTSSHAFLLAWTSLASLVPGLVR